MAVFMEPGELEQIRAEYIKAKWLMTEGRDNIVKAAVELIDVETAHEAWLLNPIMGEQELADLRARYYTAKEELREAVYKWKEAQA